MPNTQDAEPLPPDQTPDKRGGVSAQGDIEAGRDVAGRDIAGRDIAGRDIVTGTTNIGFSQEAVLKLVVIVGLLVFISAACFFSSGIVIGAGVFAAINRPVNSNQEAAERFQNKMVQIQNLPTGQPFIVAFTETEISSYFRFKVAPQLGIEDGKVRLLSENRLAIKGKFDSLGGRSAIATFDIQENDSQPLRLTGAAIQLLDLGNGPFGWVAVPTSILEPFADQINELLGANFRVTNVKSLPGVPQPAWQLSGIATGQ